ncbi:MAG: GNAT family N-acetyltransferase [Rhodobacteraceae bacterium]|nr:GNAT family N-acetyltransferase [Paracoccaceae bacterium]
MALTITAGVLPEHHHDAARLYWQAFGQKLGKVMGPERRALGFFEATLNPAAIISAVEDGQLIGIAAYKLGDSGFSQSGAGDIFRHYGVGTIWRLPLLAMLERSAPDDTLQMDGICVDTTGRGKGVGTALLNAIVETARAKGLAKVTLDVIDSNPRARVLYERFGFEKTATETLGPLRHIFGFSSADKMVLTLAKPLS